MGHRLTSDAHPWSRTERKVGPAHRFEISPPFRLKFVCISPVNILPSVESIGVDLNKVSLWYEDWGLAVRATAARNKGVLVGKTTI